MEHNLLSCLIGRSTWLGNFTYDVKSTFLNEHIKEDVYVKQPCGFIVPNLEHKVCKLKRTFIQIASIPSSLA
jgi:hypothetical protein